MLFEKVKTFLGKVRKGRGEGLREIKPEEKVSERLKTFFGKVKKGLGERLSEVKLEDIAKFGAKEFTGAIPVVGPFLKDVIDEFSPDEKEELIKELKELSESQFKEISEKVGVSVEYLESIQKFTLYTFEELHADHRELKELLLHLIKIQTREVTIPPIQSTLRKGETTKGDFFKKEPEWIDFEDGFVVERKEVDEIIQKLETDNIQLVVGKPASGKSVILKNIGFNLANKNKDVYIVELKKHSRDDVKCYFDDIPEIKDEKAVFIVDDAHLFPKECERLIRVFKNRDSKLIIGTRPTREIFPENPKKVSEFENLKSITRIHAEEEEVTEGMIKTFLTRKHHLNDERINRVSENLERYKEDLWFLSWALKAYKPEKDSVEEEEIYEKVKESIEDISTGAEDVFLPLSVFYRFEIPIEERFLTEQMGVEINIIEQLINLSEITETEEIGKRKVFSLNHSSIADLYFRTYQSYPDFGRDVKKIFEQGDDDWEYPMFYRYINSAPMDSFDILNRLGCYSIKEGKPLIGELIEDKETKFSIEKAIEREVSVLKIAEYLKNMVYEEYEELAIKFVKSYIDTLLSKIEINRIPHNDIWPIGNYVGVIAIGGKEVQSKLFDVVSPKIEKEENVGKIGTVVGSIKTAWADWDPTTELARKLVNQNFDTLLSKIENEEDGGKIGVFISNISVVNPEVVTQIIDHKIDTFLWQISIALQEVSAEKPIPDIDFFLDPTPPLHLEEKFIQRVVNGVREIVNNIGFDTLSSRIEQEGDIEKIGDIAKLLGHVGIQLRGIINNHVIANILSKIEKEEDVGKISWCVKNIAAVSETAGMALVDSVITNISSKIEKEEDLEKICVCIRRMATVSETAGMALVDSVPSKIEKVEDLEKICLCIWRMATVSETLGMALVDSVPSKIEKVEDLEALKTRLAWLEEESEALAQKFVNRLNPKLREELQKRGW